MNLGWLDVCLTVECVKKSQEFYQKLGFQRVEGNDDEGWAVVVNQNSRLGLYQKEHMGKATHTLNFRGENVLKIKEELERKGLQFEHDFCPKSDGTGSALLKDPDGHPIFFDTAPGETKKLPTNS